MSWIDALKKQVLDTVGSGAGTGPGSDAPVDPNAPAGMFDHVVAMIRDKGMGNLGSMFDAKGMKDVFASWVSKGSNLPISVDQIKKIFGAEKLEAIAKKLGLPVGQASALLAQVLPQMVDKMTPDGAIEEPAAETVSPDETESSEPASF
jgi:uncharacterized protein YidB (DUF937 family)